MRFSSRKIDQNLFLKNRKYGLGGMLEGSPDTFSTLYASLRLYNLSDCRDVEVIVRIKRGYLKCEETTVVYGAELGQAVSVVSGKITGNHISPVDLLRTTIIATHVYKP